MRCRFAPPPLEQQRPAELPASPFQTLRRVLAVGTLVLVVLEQPGTAARAADIGAHRLAVLRRRDRRGILHRRLGNHAWKRARSRCGP
jgi:hypothetical protein